MNNLNSLGRRAGRAVAGALTLGVVFAGIAPAYADVTPPPVADMGKTYIGSGSDTTYDMMKALDKVYAGSNGCATIWASSAAQPKDGSCDPASAASGNDTLNYPWVNATHDAIVEDYPVGSGAGIKELCNQGKANVRNVDFARSSSGPSTSPSCTDLMYVAYAKDAVSWWHATADKTGAATDSADIASISKSVLASIYNGTITQWSGLNNNAGVLDANGAQLTNLPAHNIKVYTVQAGSGTLSFWTGSSGINATITSGAISTGQENNPAKIFADNNESSAIYFMSVGRYKQEAAITGTNNYAGSSVSNTYPLATDALGKIDTIAPTPANLIASSGAFPLARNVYNVLRYPTAQILKYMGPEGFLCSNTIGAYVDRITGSTYQALRENAISSEGFVPLPSAATGGSSFSRYAADTVGGFGASHCRVSDPTVSGQTDSAGPAVGVQNIDGSTLSSAASVGAVFNLNFDAVTSVDTTKLGIKSNGAFVPATYTCYNQKSVVVDCAGSASTPYAQAVINLVKVVPNAPLTGGTTVRYVANAGFGSDRQGNAAVAVDSNTNDVAVPKTAPSITWNADANSVIHDQSGSYTYNLSQLVTVSGTDATPTYAIDVSTPGSATATVSGSTLSVTAPGTISVSVSTDATASANAGTAVTRSFVLNGGAASFNWVPNANAQIGTLSATGAATTITLADLGAPSATGATANLSVIGGTASAYVASDRQSVVVTKPGTITISVDISATNTTAASSAARTVSVGKATAVVSLKTIPAASLKVGKTLVLNSLINGPAGIGSLTWTISGTAKYTKIASNGVTILTFTKKGTLTVKVAAAANDSFNAVAQVTKSGTVK